MGTGGIREFFRRPGAAKALGAVLLQAVGLVIALDVLAWNVGPSMVGWETRQLAAPRPSPWTDAANDGLTLPAKELTIDIAGDELTATYTVTAPAGSMLGAQAAADGDSDAGNDLVDNDLGAVTVAEFRYGFTGSQYVPATLSFQPPVLTVGTTTNGQNHVIDTVTVRSDPLRLYQHRQQLAVLPPAVTVKGGMAGTDVHVAAPGSEISSLGSLTMGTAAAGSDDLSPSAGYVGQSPLTFTLSEAGAGAGWLEGVRAIGGTTIPYLDPLLSRLNVLFLYAVFWWGLAAAGRRLKENHVNDGGVVDAATKVIRTLVLGLAAVAGIGLSFDVSRTPFTDPPALMAWIAAGPIGLLIGGAALVWPAACWRWTSDSASAGPAGPQAGTGAAWPSRVLTWLRYLGYLAAVGLAAIVVTRHLTGHVQEAAAIAAVALLAPPLVRRLCGGGLRGALVTVGFIAVCLVATLAPALLWQGWQGTAEVSLLGKCAYLAVAALTTVGLCVLTARGTWVMFRRYRDRLAERAKRRDAGSSPERDARLSELDGRLRLAAVVCACAGCVLVIAAIVPDAVSESAIADRGAVGLSGSDVFQLFDALPALVDWLALYFALLAVTLLPAKVGVRAAAREIAIPVFLVLAYYDNGWLYLPVTMITGYCLARWVLLPAPLAAARPARTGGSALKAALADWREADFAGSQRDALGTSSTDALRGALLGGKWDDYIEKLDTIGRAHEDLGARQEGYRAKAYAAQRRAFSHYGTKLRPRAALAGALTGALIGVLPIAISLMTTAPPSDSGSYPVLNFLGSTAWTLLTWTGVGWFIGYFLPLIRGGNGVEKGLWLLVAWAVGPVLGALAWDDAGNWRSTAVGDLQALVVLVLVAVIVGDLMTLREAGLGVQDWTRIHNWRFVATWTTALAAAIGTIAIAVATATITDLSQQQFVRPPASGQSAGSPTTGH